MYNDGSVSEVLIYAMRYLPVYLIFLAVREARLVADSPANIVRCARNNAIELAFVDGAVAHAHSVTVHRTTLRADELEL